jgi:hypothetical protein
MEEVRGSGSDEDRVNDIETNEAFEARTKAHPEAALLV